VVPVRGPDHESRDLLPGPLARQIVMAHGGSIWLETEPESGTRVHFTIPLVPNPKELTT